MTTKKLLNFRSTKWMLSSSGIIVLGSMVITTQNYRPRTPRTIRFNQTIVIGHKLYQQCCVTRRRVTQLVYTQATLCTTIEAIPLFM
ncbi:unnamed protein product [Periconia digitata]|uniref:Uncharacterized protein n=1 Tax=Periconia digitata TaxID=1303443 RepID=A0A9W4U4I0_9PLEO|nr:unnamed protein product [Periconia digitata]